MLFKSILDEAEKQVGFTVNDCKLLIEAFSSSEGYVIFTLTKYKNENTATQTKKLKCKRKIPKTTSKNAIYKFNTFEEFCDFCTYFTNNLSICKNLAKNISLYEYNNVYYLILSNIVINSKEAKLFFTKISEFSNLISNSDILKSKLLEYGTVIFKNNAITNCLNYFN